MIEFLKRKAYQRNVLRRIENDLLEFHGEELGGECLGVFATSILTAQKVAGFPPDMVNDLRERGFSEADAALAFLDSSVTALKRLYSQMDESEDVARVLKALEEAIDHIFLRNKGMIVPRNGFAGPMMDDFAKDIA